MPAQEQKISNNAGFGACNKAFFGNADRRTLLATSCRSFSGYQHTQVLLNWKRRLSSVRDVLAEKPMDEPTVLCNNSSFGYSRLLFQIIQKMQFK